MWEWSTINYYLFYFSFLFFALINPSSIIMRHHIIQQQTVPLRNVPYHTIPYHIILYRKVSWTDSIKFVFFCLSIFTTQFLSVQWSSHSIFFLFPVHDSLPYFSSLFFFIQINWIVRSHIASSIICPRSQMLDHDKTFTTEMQERILDLLVLFGRSTHDMGLDQNKERLTLPQNECVRSVPVPLQYCRVCNSVEYWGEYWVQYYYAYQ